MWEGQGKHTKAVVGVRATCIVSFCRLVVWQGVVELPPTTAPPNVTRHCTREHSTTEGQVEKCTQLAKALGKTGTESRAHTQSTHRDNTTPVSNKNTRDNLNVVQTSPQDRHHSERVPIPPTAQPATSQPESETTALAAQQRGNPPTDCGGQLWTITQTDQPGQWIRPGQNALAPSKKIVCGPH